MLSNFEVGVWWLYITLPQIGIHVCSRYFSQACAKFCVLRNSACPYT